MKNTEIGSYELQFQILVNALKLLSKDYKDQIASFPEFVVITEELALGYEDAFLLVKQLHKANFISNEALTVLIEINLTLSNMKKAEALWSKEGLENSASWEKCRQLSRNALDLIRKN